MLEKVQELVEKVEGYVPKSEEELNNFKIKYLGKKVLLNDLFSSFKEIPNEQKKEFGASINKLKELVQEKIDTYIDSFEEEVVVGDIDLTKAISLDNLGSRHPIALVRNQIVEIFNRIGFTVSEGPEIEDDWHNFSALNLPEEHPAKDMQDTFFIDKDIVLRTHTSNVQIHLMEENDPPLRFIVPGRVYRNEAISYKSYCLFHQVEGLYVDKKVSFGQLKGCLEYFVKRMFGENCKMRWRPSYFPFTEPSAEVDIWDEQRNQWMEILGCGMVDPEVFNNVGYDPKIWHGYAFGMGVERIAMLKYDVDDIRLFYNGDIRFLRQFR